MSICELYLKIFLIFFCNPKFIINYKIKNSDLKFNDKEYNGPLILKFEGCKQPGWTCNYFPGEIQASFSCPKDYQEKYPEIKWTFEGLKPSVHSVTIQNCDLPLYIEEESFYRLNRFVIKDVAELILAPRKRELHLKARKNNITHLYESRIKTLVIEKVKFIRTLIFGTIWGKFEEVNIRKCNFGRLEWHAFHKVEASLFSFTDNEINVVKEGAFDIKADHVKIIGNLFNFLETGSFYEVYIGDDEDDQYDNWMNALNETIFDPLIEFESNTIYATEVGGLIFGNPLSFNLTLKTNSTRNVLNGTLIVPEYNISVHHNQFNCSLTKWLYDITIDPDEENEKINRLKESRKKYFDKISLFTIPYVIDQNDNVCNNLDCDMSLRIYRDRFDIYGPKVDICKDLELRQV